MVFFSILENVFQDNESALKVLSILRYSINWKSDTDDRMLLLGVPELIHFFHIIRVQRLIRKISKFWKQNSAVKFLAEILIRTILMRHSSRRDLC